MKRNPELDTPVLGHQEKDNKSTPNPFQRKTNDAFILEAERLELIGGYHKHNVNFYSKRFDSKYSVFIKPLQKDIY